jgi:hypothetical protein
MSRLTALSRRTKLALGALAAVVVVGAGGGAAIAAFVATTSNPGNTFSAAASFASQSVFTAFDVGDASGGGGETNADWTAAYDDSRYVDTGNWATTYAAGRYIDFDMSNPLPPGRQTPTASFRFRFASGSAFGGGDACFYFEVRRISTGAVLGTYGSSGSPVACSNGTTQLTSTTDISAQVASTDIANDLRIRVYGIETAARDWDVDSATITGSTPLVNFTLYPHEYRDSADTTPATTTWGVAAAGDGASYQSAANWTTGFSGTRYIDLTYPAYVPAGSTVGTVTFSYAYRSATAGDTTCWYFQVRNSGGTVIGTHGSSFSPISCNNTTSFVTNNTNLPEVNTVAEANAVTIRVFHRNSGSRRTLSDYAGLTVNY